MSYSGLFRLAFSFRVVATILLIWLLSSTSSMAWQNLAYRPYYPQTAYNIQYKPYTQLAYYRPYYPGYYYSPQTTYAPVQARLETDINKDSEQQASLNEKNKRDTLKQTQDISSKKQAFIDALLPFIQKENARLKQLRVTISYSILALDAGFGIPKHSQTLLLQLAKKYRVQGNILKDIEARADLLKKIDIIPASLTLAQAANESAWGKSRFATEANNVFGIWTFDKSKGLKPRNREADKKHLVRKFENLGESVKYYMHMLNSHPAYKKLRDIRHQARQNNQTPDGLAMAGGLEKYSARGKQYIQLIQDLILQNQWVQLDTKGQSV